MSNHDSSYYQALSLNSAIAARNALVEQFANENGIDEGVRPDYVARRINKRVTERLAAYKRSEKEFRQAKRRYEAHRRKIMGEEHRREVNQARQLYDIQGRINELRKAEEFTLLRIGLPSTSEGEIEEIVDEEMN